MISKTSITRRQRPFWGFLAIVVLAAGFFVPNVEAGTVIELKTVYYDEDKPEEDTKIFLGKDRLRFEAMEDGKQMILIITLDDAGEPVCRVIDAKARSYTEITRESAKKVRTQIEQGKAQMEEQLKNMPEDQRDKMRQMMEDQLSQFEGAANVTFKRVASGVEMSKWTCVQYESLINGAKHEDIWTADWKQIGLKKSDTEIFRKFGSLFEGVSPETNAFFHVGKSESSGGFDGFPVLVVEYKDGAKHEKSEVRAITDEKLDDDLFVVPKGFTKVSMFDR